MNEFVKEVRADVDKEVSESNKTFEANLKRSSISLPNKPNPAARAAMVNLTPTTFPQL